MQYAVLLLVGFAAFANGQFDFMNEMFTCDFMAKAGELQACQMPVITPAIIAITQSKEITKGQVCSISKGSFDCMVKIGCLTEEARDRADITPHLKKVGVDCDSDDKNSEVLVKYAACLDSDTSEKISECITPLLEMMKRLTELKPTIETVREHGCQFAKHAFSCVKGCVEINSKYDVIGAVLNSLKAQGYKC